MITAVYKGLDVWGRHYFMGDNGRPYCVPYNTKIDVKDVVLGANRGRMDIYGYIDNDTSKAITDNPVTHVYLTVGIEHL